MRYFKWLTPSLMIILLFFLSACGMVSEKPTGLEDSDSQTSQIEVTEKNEQVEHKKTDDKKESSKEDTSEDDKDQPKKSNSQSTKEDADHKGENNQASKHTNEKTRSKQKDESKKTSSQKSDAKKKQSSRSEKASDKKAKKDKSNSNQKTSESKTSNEKKEAKKSSKSIVVQSIVISSNEIPLSPTEIEIEEEDTVLDALIAVTKKHGVHMDYRGGQGGSAYVQGMGNVYEFDRGQGSGWMFRVNDVFPDRGAGVVPLKDGDRIEWLYTTDLGEDLGADLQPFRR